MRNYEVVKIFEDAYYIDKNNIDNFIVHITFSNRYEKYYSIGLDNFGIYLNFIRK